MREDYRHEIKHEITYADLLTIRQRMRIIAEPDAHAKDGTYFIRSLYFDTPQDTALREKIAGTAVRQKFRIRSYNQDPGFIRLEKKSKWNGLGTKDMAKLTEEETRSIIAGDTAWMAEDERELVRELYTQMKTTLLEPRTIVDYTRQPFTYRPGNVRVTLDYNIRTGLRSTDFFDYERPTIPVKDSPIILEVKWDGFLPEVIRDAVQIEKRAGAYSKYMACRMYD
ncbi:MAG: polyphosphate polymerase domain-containing protein [Lachnospiraceae bacterium]|nr:polyphosphate polymerase domain-containing protein [Lachnospiraceae bacterium]